MDLCPLTSFLIYGPTLNRVQGKISDVDIQRLAIETGEHFTLDEVSEMIQAADENGEQLAELPFSRWNDLNVELLPDFTFGFGYTDAGDGEVDLEEFVKMMKRTNFGARF